MEWVQERMEGDRGETIGGGEGGKEGVVKQSYLIVLRDKGYDSTFICQ